MSLLDFINGTTPADMLGYTTSAFNAAMASGKSPAQPRIERWSQVEPVPMRGMNSGMRGTPGAPLMGPDTPQQMDPEVINKFLAPYGQALPTSINPNIMFGNTSQFAADHPRVAGALDNIIGTLANTNGSATVGEGISNVARGLMANRTMHQQNVMSQLMAPFGMADQTANLQKLSDAHNLNMAHENYFNSMGDYHRGMLQSLDDYRKGELANKTKQLDDMADYHRKSIEERDKTIDVMKQRLSTGAFGALQNHIQHINQGRIENGQDPLSPDQENQAMKEFFRSYHTRDFAPTRVDPRDKQFLDGAEKARKDADAELKNYESLYKTQIQYGMDAQAQQEYSGLKDRAAAARSNHEATLSAFQHKYNPKAPQSKVGALVDRYKDK